MNLTDALVRAVYPVLMSNRLLRQLPGRIGPTLGRGFLAALKRANGERLAEAERSGQARFAAYPGFITVAGTSRCNIRCEFCINQWDAAPDGSNRPHMREEHLQRVVAEVFPYIRKLALSVSGEPLYDPHFLYLLEQARKYGVFVEFTTNAMLVSKPGYLDAILDNVGRVNISMDGATAATYERLRQGARFDKVCANIKSMTEGRRARGQPGPEFNMRYILMTETIEELPAMVDLCKDLGIDHLFTNHLQVFMESLAPQSLMFHKRRANEIFAEARRRAAARDMVVVLPEDFPLDAAESATDAPEPQPVAAAMALGEVDTAANGAAAELDASAAVGFGNTPITTEDFSGETWAASGAVERTVARPEELPPSAYSHRCPYLWDQAFFEADGSVFPCCNSGGVALGHMEHAKDFFEVWTGDDYVRMRDTVYTAGCHDICVNCYLREDTAATEAYLRPVEGAQKGGWQRGL